MGDVVTLAVVRALREPRRTGAADMEGLETDVLAGFVLARASAGLMDGTIRGDVSHLDRVREWFGRPLWEMDPADADEYFGRELRDAPIATRLARSAAVAVFFEFLELRHKVEIHALSGRVVESPIDEVNRPRGGKEARLRIPPQEEEMHALFVGWAASLASCRKFAPMARNYAAARLMAEVGLRVNEARSLDLADVHWELGRFGKLHVRLGKGARGSGPPPADGAVGQRRGVDLALVYRRRLGPVRC
jgi:integrase/recombinase XerD